MKINCLFKILTMWKSLNLIKLLNHNIIKHRRIKDEYSNNLMSIDKLQCCEKKSLKYIYLYDLYTVYKRLGLYIYIF